MGWTVHSCSSESPVHSAGNVVLEELYRIWQTNEACEEAWLILQSHPPTPFHKLEIVNAGSSLLEVYGSSAPHVEGEEDKEELLLSTQQVMTLKDLTNKCNRNRSFTFTIPQKLSPIAAEKRWKHLRIICRQPFGTSEHRSCIGLSRVNIISYNTGDVLTEGNDRDPLHCSELTSTPIVNTKNQSLNVISEGHPESTDGKSEVKKRKLPIWSSINEDIPEDTKHETLGNDGPTKDQKGKSLRGSSDNTAGYARNCKSRLADDKEAQGSILPRDERKLNSSGSPDSSQQQTKHQNSNNPKGSAEGNSSVASHSGGRDMSDFSAQGKETDHCILQSQSERDVVSFSTLLEGVVFAISGLVNPERANLRSQVLEMGAEYQPDWNPRCTLLICAFPNTPKFRQVKDDNGSIVSKEWVTECYKQKKLVEIDPYLMHAGKPWRKRYTSNISDVSDNSITGKQQEKAEGKLHDGKNISVRVVENKARKANVKSNEKLDFNPSKVQRWVVEDLNTAMSWLQEQKEKPQPSELKETAIQGIMVCLEDTIKCLKENKDVCAMLDKWEFIPRIVKELATFEDGKKGSQMQSREKLCRMADSFRSIYEMEFKNIKNVTQLHKGKNKVESEQQSSGPHRNVKLALKDNTKAQPRDDDDSDDATEVMSDDGSKDDADNATDDTQVMDEDELVFTEETVTKRYSG